MELIRQVKYERTTDKAFYTAEPTIYRITTLQNRIVKQKQLVEETEDENRNSSSLETHGYDLPLYIEEMKAMLRNSERELNNLLGLPPSADELEEDRLKKEFILLSFKAGMYAYVREELIDASDYILDLKSFWKEHIDACLEAIDTKSPLLDY